MDDIQRPRQNATRPKRSFSTPQRASLVVAQPVQTGRHITTPVQHHRKVKSSKQKKTLTINFSLPNWLIKNKFYVKSQKILRVKSWPRYTFLMTVSAVIFAVLLTICLPYFDHRWEAHAYALSGADKQAITKPDDVMAKSLVHDSANRTYNFSPKLAQSEQSGNDVSFGGGQIRAVLNEDSSKGVTITDPASNVDFTVTPKFDTLRARQTKNQIEYPFKEGDGNLVYTAQAVGVKEDILLRHEAGDTLKFEYQLGLGDQYAAKILPDGSLGIYGSSLPLGNVSTGSDKDAALLQKARKNAVKDKFLFSMPAPTIHEASGNISKARAVYSLRKSTLTVTATRLKKANYPLSIDPTVQIASTSEFYRNTSIESNADFDAANNKITRGALTGGTTGTWTATSTMNQSRFLGGAVAYNGFVYVVGGSAAASTTNIAGNSANMVEYASISTANPSTLGTWTAGNNIGLPAGGLSRFQLIAYHGYIYAIGGSGTDTTCTAGNLSTVVYYAPVQVNGILGNWSTTNAPSVARCSFGAAAYNGKIYIAGGKTGAAAATGTTDVSYATANPSGTLTWTVASASPLPAARYGADLQAYNGYLYLVGGNLNGTLTNTVLFAALNTDGTIFTTNWPATNSITTARENFGAGFTTIKNGYIYLSGGCKNVNASQTCNTAGDVLNDTQLAQINADGSLGQWATTTTLVAVNVGAVMLAWRNTVYNIGGCSGMNAASIYCTSALGSTQYSTIAGTGQASVLKTAASNLPTALFGAAAAVNNGYLYVVGGCITNSCQVGAGDTTNATSYAQINADGTLGTWTTDTLNTINGLSGIAETSLLSVNGTLYAMGGYVVGATAGANTIWTVTPTSTGALPGAWAANATTLNNRAYGMSALYFNGYLYTFGGCVGTTGATFGCSANSYLQQVTRYSVNGTTIGAGSTTGLTQLSANTTDFPNAVMALAFYNSYIYLCGGASDAAGQTQKCAYAKMNATGSTIGAWTLTTGKLNETITANNTATHPIRRAAAYASNGYLYVYSGHDGGTNAQSVGTINIGKIDPSTGNILSNFSISSTSFTPKWDSASAFADGNIYTVGGCTAGAPPTSCTTRSAATEYFQIYNATNSGTRNISSTTAIPAAQIGPSALAYNGYMYIVGGCNNYGINSANCSGAVTTTSYQTINPDGSLASATWSSGGGLPAARGFGCLVALSNTLYYIAGTSSGPAQNEVYYATIGANGVPGAWAATNNGATPTPAATALPAAKLAPSCATYNNRIYVTGGSTSATTYYSPSLPNGGGVITSWTTAANTFTNGRSYHSAVAAGGYLYVMGGYDGSNYLSDVQFTQLNTSTGAPGTWTYTADLPLKLRQAGAFAANGYIYLLGGATGTASTNCLSTTFVASINSPGHLGAWQQGVATSFTGVSGAGVTYYNGYYYLAGGNNCTANVATMSYGGEQSQAIRSIFTRYIDFLGDATPQKFVVNGTNAAVNGVDIDKWRLSYTSSRVATNAFGKTTAITPLAFGSNPAAITAVDAAGANQGVSRYWLLSFDIDQAQSFTFTDDTQPSIISYSFYYSPSGNTRLRNGRIFQDQSKQALDAHP